MPPRDAVGAFKTTERLARVLAKFKSRDVHGLWKLFNEKEHGGQLFQLVTWASATAQPGSQWLGGTKAQRQAFNWALLIAREYDKLVKAARAHPVSGDLATELASLDFARAMKDSGFSGRSLQEYGRFISRPVSAPPPAPP